MSNHTKKFASIPAQTDERQQLKSFMASKGMPQVAEAIKRVAGEYARLTSGDGNPDPFDIDEAANTIMGEIVSFLWLCSPDFRDAPLLHFRQLTDEHFKSWWGSE